jgi:hypothetical protein
LELGMCLPQMGLPVEPTDQQIVTSAKQAY